MSKKQPDQKESQEGLKGIDKLKDSVSFVINGAPNLLKAYAKKIIGDSADTDLQQFRKEACENCRLFTGSNCNKRDVATNSDESKYPQAMSLDESIAIGFSSSKVHGTIRTVVSPDGDVYFRGCGCPQTGEFAKWKSSFSDSDLELKDGTAACPMGKWTTGMFNKWKEKDGKQV